MSVKQVGQSEGAEAHAGAAEEVATRRVMGRRGAEQVEVVRHAYVSGFDFSTVEDSVYRRRFKSVGSIPIPRVPQFRRNAASSIIPSRNHRTRKRYVASQSDSRDFFRSAAGVRAGWAARL